MRNAAKAHLLCKRYLLIYFKIKTNNNTSIKSLYGGRFTAYY